MTNTEWLFEILRHFQNDRKAITDTYESKLKELEATRGSKYYDTESTKARETRDTALDKLKKETRAKTDKAIGAMNTVNEGRTLTTPPSDEQLRLLETLKLRDKLTDKELQAAAKSCADNVTALSVINDLAAKNGIARRYNSAGTDTTMSIEDVRREIGDIFDCVDDFIESDEMRAARIAARHNETFYGGDTHTPRKRELFDSKEDCYRVLCNMNADSLESFSKAVDASEGANNGD